MKRKFRFHLDTPFIGTEMDTVREFDFPDFATEADIERAVYQELKEWRDENIPYWHEEIKDE